MARVVLTRRYSFHAVHSLKNHLEKRHGHHYTLEVSFRPGVDWSVVDQCVRITVITPLHAHEITQIDPATGENIVNWIHSQLFNTKLGPYLEAVAIQETAKNRFISQKTEPRYV